MSEMFGRILNGYTKGYFHLLAESWNKIICPYNIGKFKTQRLNFTFFCWLGLNSIGYLRVTLKMQFLIWPAAVRSFLPLEFFILCLLLMTRLNIFYCSK